MVRLIFYSRKGCPLCDEAEEMIERIKKEYDIDIAKIDIDSDKNLYELYRFDIPIIEFRDGSTLHGQILQKNLIKKLEENRE